MNLLYRLQDPKKIYKSIRRRAIERQIKRFEPEKKSVNGFERIYHVHIRKCAGTSLNKAILDALGAENNTYEELASCETHRLTLKGVPVVGWNKNILKKEAFYFGFSHIPTHKLNLGTDTYTFTFLRDPVERLVSHYKMLKDMEFSGSSHPVLAKESCFAYGDFDHFLQNIPRNKLENQLYMFSPNFDVNEALEALRELSFVGHVDNISDHFIPLIEKEFNISINYKPLRASRFQFDITAAQERRLKTMISSEVSFYEAASDEFL